jgi:hypothetical protein
MSLAESEMLQPRAPAASLDAGSSQALYRLPIYAGCTLLALIANYVLGKDLAWDTLNYQFYSGFSAVNDRFAQDYFAAGPPSYFNPYVYVPFYALVRAGLSPLAIASTLAVLHSAILWLSFELAICVCPSEDRRTRMTFGICAIALAFANPILLQQFGSSFADITTAELVVAGWLLLVQAVRQPHAAKIVCAGLLLGAASSLKLTNAVHALSACALLIMVPRPVTIRLRYVVGYFLTLGLGFALIAAPWSYRLEQMFGNPMFPLMNGLFRSPEFTTEPLRHFRFTPDSFLSFLWRPFAIADPVPMVQEEMTSPDLRYAVVAVLAIVIFARALWQRRAPSPRSARAEPSMSERALAALSCGLALDWILWLSASGNGRYFLPMSIVTAVLIVALLYRVFPIQLKARNYALIAILGAQFVQLDIAANYRWNQSPWDPQWLNVEVPEKLATESNLYLTIGIQSNSFIAPFLAPGSGMINFSGGYALGPEGAGGARIQALMQRYASHVRVLWRGEDKPLNAQTVIDSSLPDDALARFGLRVDTSDCAMIIVHGLMPEPVIKYVTSEPATPVSPAAGTAGTSYLTSCRAVADRTDSSALFARERAVDLVLDRVEDACPELFQPRRMRTEHYRGVWRRLYVNTDLVALVFHGSVKFSNPVRGLPMIDLGRESDWAKELQPLTCGRRDGHYFAKLLKSEQH